MIIKLEKQKKDNRFNLFVDGEFYSGLNVDQVAKYNLKSGQDLEKDVIDQIVLESETFYAFNKVLKYISKSMKTEHDLQKYLMQKGFKDDVIQQTIQKLKDYNYLNDELYVKSYVETYKNKYGINKIKQNLKNKNIDEELINQFLNLDEKEVILNIKKEILKQTKNKELDLKQKQRLYRNLTYKGYSFEQIKKAFSMLGEDDENWD